MKLLNEYENGNVLVTLYEDGTKVQEWDGEAKPVYPNSIDIKITNYCDLDCEWCHEISTRGGKHGNLLELLENIKDLPSGTELAIGGGNPLSHPKLEDFLKVCKSKGLIPNLTINYKHVEEFLDMINYFIEEKLAYGIGISVEDDFDPIIFNKFVSTSNVVFHVISGVNKISVLDKIKKSKVNKILILGYKQFGRGLGYYNSEVESCKEDWFNNLRKYIKKHHLSFDNLAVKQLDIKRFLTSSEWDEFYMGEDGQFTMYIDAVKRQYAVSSTNSKRFNLGQNDIKNIFKNIIFEKSMRK